MGNEDCRDSAHEALRDAECQRIMNNIARRNTAVLGWTCLLFRVEPRTVKTHEAKREKTMNCEIIPRALMATYSALAYRGLCAYVEVIRNFDPDCGDCST